MGFFFREHLKLGKFLKLNFSKSGIGLSGGITGLRLGIGPKGTWFHAGRHGLYYRKSLNGLINNNAEKTDEKIQETEQQYVAPEIENHTAEVSVTGEKIPPVDLCNKINKLKFLLICLCVISVFAGWHIVFYAAALAFFLIKFDITATCFDTSDEINSKYQEFMEAFNTFTQTFHLNTSDVVTETKGDLPLFCKMSHKDLKLPTLIIGTTKYFFAPEFVITKTDFGGYKALFYNELDLAIELKTVHCKTHKIFADEEVLSQTWEHVKKDGTPNLRYKDNPEIYTTKMYGIRMFGNTWLCPKREVLENLANALKGLKENLYFIDSRQEPEFIDFINIALQKAIQSKASQLQAQQTLALTGLAVATVASSFKSSKRRKRK